MDAVRGRYYRRLSSSLFVMTPHLSPAAHFVNRNSGCFFYKGVLQVKPNATSAVCLCQCEHSKRFETTQDDHCRRVSGRLQVVVVVMSPVYRLISLHFLFGSHRHLKPCASFFGQESWKHAALPEVQHVDQRRNKCV